MKTKPNTLTKADIDTAMAEIVNAFLRWPLPESVNSDRCVTERGYKHRSGTNLLTCPETVSMVQEVVRPVVESLLTQAMDMDPRDGERLNHLEELIRQCPHAEFDYSDDPDEDKPQGYSISVDGCDPSESVGASFRECIDEDIKLTHRRNSE